MELSKQNKQMLIHFENKMNDIAQIFASHLNMNTDAINILDKRINGIQAKAIIGWQCRKKTWADNCWSNVVLFVDGEIKFPEFGSDWEFRHVYVDV